MNEVPTKILNKIFTEIEIKDENTLNTNFDAVVFDYVSEFLTEYESTNYPEIIYQNSKGVSALKIGSLLDMCIWSTSDNGNKQINEQRLWFRGSNKRKIEIVLNVSNVFPLNEHDELITRLNEIKVEFPVLSELCEYWKIQAKQLRK